MSCCPLKDSHLQEGESPSGTQRQKCALQKGHQKLLPTEPSVSDVETWLEWQANQLGTLCLVDRTPSHSRHEGSPQKLAWKIRASFYIPEVRMRTLLEPGYTASPTPRSLNRNAFLPEDLSYQDVPAKTSPLDNCLYQESSVLGRETKSYQETGTWHSLAESVVELLGGGKGIHYLQPPRCHTGV